jgi:anti-sigma factor RsiW
MTRNEIEQLLPFLANGTLEGAERDAVEAAVAGDPALQSELTALRAIRETLQAEEAFSPGDMGLARLMRAVDDEQVTHQPSSRPYIWQFAAAMLLAVVVGQALWFAQPDGGPGYELAGRAAFEISVVETTPEADLRALLLQAGVEIIAGPSALGLYALQPLEGVTETEARAVLQASPLIESLSDITE